MVVQATIREALPCGAAHFQCALLDVIGLTLKIPSYFQMRFSICAY